MTISTQEARRRKRAVVPKTELEARLLACLERSGTVWVAHLHCLDDDQLDSLRRDPGMLRTNRWSGNEWIAGPTTLDWMIRQKLRPPSR